MESLKKALSSFLEEGLPADDASRKARRAAEVNGHWRKAVERVYGEASPFILSHINAVYIVAADAEEKGKGGGEKDLPEEEEKKGGERGARGPQRGECSLFVYADDSLVRSDIDARREFLRMALLEEGESIGEFKILASRLGMKGRHPYADLQDGREGEIGSAAQGKAFSPAAERELTKEEEDEIAAFSARAGEGEVSRSFRRALSAYRRSNPPL